MIEVIQAIGMWIVLGPVFYCLGRFLCRKWLHADSPVLQGIFFVAFGLGAVGYGVIALGTYGFLKAEIVWGSLALIFLLSLRNVPAYVQWLKDLIYYLFLRPASGFCLGVRIIFLLSIALSLLSSLVPEIANDSLAYHLNLPKIFIQNQSILPLTYDEKSFRSLFMEELFTIPMFFKNIPATIFFHWLTTFLLILAVVVWIEEEIENYACALFLGVLFWLTPTLFNQVAISYTDGSVAFFAFLGFYLLQQGWRNQLYKADFFLGGLLLGLSVSAKYLTLMMCGAIGVALIFVFFLRRTNKKYLFVGMLLLGLGVLLTASYWFIRNHFLTGDFLYPLFTKQFGTSGLYSDQKFSQIGVPKNVLSFLSLPFFISVFPDLFNRHHWAGPAYFFIFPAAFFSLRDSKARPTFIIAFLGTLFWFALAQDIRFLLSVFPLWVGLSGFALSWAAPYLSAPWQRTARIIGLAGLCCYLALGIYHYRVQLWAVVQHWEKGVFLTRLERSYPAAEWLNKNIPKNAKIFNALEVRAYYFDREMIDGSMFYRIHSDMREASPSDLHRILKIKGVTHVLRCQLVDQTKLAGRPNLYFALDRALETPGLFKKLIKIQSQNIREDQYQYEFYELIG